MGWNTWNTFGENINEELLKKTADYIVESGLRDLGYDYVIIDTPPILVISDALALTPIVDGAVLVCRHEASYVSDISRAINTLRFSKANILGVIVNDYKESHVGKYGGYSKKYSYGYSYGYGYAPDPTEEDKKA